MGTLLALVVHYAIPFLTFFDFQKVPVRLWNYGTVY